MSWQDFERFLREKADASDLAELEASCATVAALERVELGLARAAGMEEVCDGFDLGFGCWCLSVMVGTGVCTY